MRLWLTVLALLISVGPPAGAQEMQGPEPIVFVYSYDESSGKFLRTPYQSRQQALNALQGRRQEAVAAAAALNAQVQSNVNVETVADWLIYFEQWHLWQEWVKQEYDLSDLGELTFEAVPGTPLSWEETPEAEAALQQSRQQFAGAGGAASFSGREEAELVGAEGGGAVIFQASPQGQEVAGEPPPNFTIQTFMSQDAAGQELSIATIGQMIQAQVQDRARKRYEVLGAVLDEIEESERMRERREALFATYTDEINALRDIILNRQAATEVNVEGRTYLFSEQPLNRVPPGAINITTPNLTPHDIFNPDGTPRLPQ